MLVQSIETLAHIVDLVGIGVIFWGVGVGLMGFVAAQLSRGAATDFFQASARARCKIGSYILFGLEILIASDIAVSVLEPSYESVILLAAIVAIRTMLSVFLSRELEALATQS